jgi:hypothetical protein
MATEKEYVSAHLDENYHVFNNGTTGKLCVTPWNRNTVADGYWQNVNTIKPLINRDIYLAECLDEIASKYTVYTPGEGIIITQNQDNQNNYTISVDQSYISNLPSYSFDTKFFNTSSTTSGTDVSIKLSTIDEYQTISADEDGLYANIDYMLYNTSSISSITISGHTYTSGLTYTYMTGELPIEFVDEIPETATAGRIYITSNPNI